MIFIDGEYKDAHASGLNPLSPGIMRGVGVFETMRVMQGKLMRLGDHMKRFKTGADALKLKLPFDDEAIEVATAEIIGRNSLADARMRMTLLKGLTKDHLIIGSEKITAEDIATCREPVALMAAGKVVASENPFRRVKTTSRADLEMFREMAVSKGKFDALLLNEKGHVTECTRANIFALCASEKKLATPRLDCGLLSGVTRTKVLKLAATVNVKTIEGLLSLEDLINADVVFMTSTSFGIRRIKSIDEHKFDMKDFTEFSALDSAYQKLVEDELAGKPTP